MIVAVIVVVGLFGVSIFVVTRALVTSRKRRGIAAAANAFFTVHFLEARCRLPHEFGRQ